MTPPPASEPLRVLIVAGEASGDLYGAALMRNLRAQSPRSICFRGIGGDAMQAEGLDLLCHCDKTAVIGFWEVMRLIRFLRRLFRHMTGELDSWKPDLLLTIDYPGFNLRLAAQAHARKIRTVHYICPQVWIWHKNRIPRIARIIDQMITLYPFEPACFDKTPLHPIYAGHPLVDHARETLARPEQPLPWGAGRRIALLPGSRKNEIEKLLPDLVAAAALLERRIGDCGFIIPAVSARIRSTIETVLAQCPQRPRQLQIVDGLAREVLRQAETAAVASGTATLEASLMRCPSVLVYRASWPTYFIVRFLIRKIGFVGLANIITKRSVMPELLQSDLSPDPLARLLQSYLTEPDARAKALEGLDAVNAILGSGGAAPAAAKAILDNLPPTS